MSAIAMYRITFRVLETWDEHFYETDQFGYHWTLNGFGLPDEILRAQGLSRQCGETPGFPKNLNFKN